MRNSVSDSILFGARNGVRFSCIDKLRYEVGDYNGSRYATDNVVFVAHFGLLALHPLKKRRRSLHFQMRRMKNDCTKDTTIAYSSDELAAS